MGDVIAAAGGHLRCCLKLRKSFAAVRRVSESAENERRPLVQLTKPEFNSRLSASRHFLTDTSSRSLTLLISIHHPSPFTSPFFAVIHFHPSPSPFTPILPRSLTAPTRHRAAMIRALNTAGLSDLEKRVVKATYDDDDPPKQKHVEG